MKPSKARRKAGRALKRRQDLLDEIDVLATERAQARAAGDILLVRKLTKELNGRFAAVENSSVRAIDLTGDEAYLRDRSAGHFAELRATSPDEGSPFRRPTEAMDATSRKPRGIKKQPWTTTSPATPVRNRQMESGS